MLPKALILMVGETFRDGGQHTRLRDTEFSYHRQKQASDSHIDFFETLKKQYNLHVHLESYETKYIDDIKSWYKNCHKFTINLRKHLHPNGITMLATEYIKNIDIDQYDWIFAYRPDLELKKYFIRNFDPTWQKLMYPNRLWLPWTHCGSLPRINDTMMYCPRNYFNILKDGGIKLYHHGLYDYIIHHGLQKHHCGFMIPTLHDSDTAKDYNPLYRMVSRNENKYWYSYGYEINHDDVYDFKLTDKQYSFDDWNLLDNNIPADEKKKIINYDNVWEWWHSEPHIINKFHNLIEFIDDPIFGQKIILSRHPDQSYWKKEDDKIIVYHNDQRVTTVFEKKNEFLYTGDYAFNKNIKLSIRKLIR